MVRGSLVQIQSSGQHIPMHQVVKWLRSSNCTTAAQHPSRRPHLLREEGVPQVSRWSYQSLLKPHRSHCNLWGVSKRHTPHCSRCAAGIAVACSGNKYGGKSIAVGIAVDGSGIAVGIAVHCSDIYPPSRGGSSFPVQEKRCPCSTT